MEFIEVIATSHFSDSRIGSVSRKQKLRVPVQVAEDLISLELVAYVNPPETTASEPQSTAPQDAGGDESSVSSQADQASVNETASSSSEPDGQQSPSTTATDEPDLQTSSTPVTDNGGEPTTEQPSETSAESSGPKTNKRKGSSE